MVRWWRNCYGLGNNKDGGPTRNRTGVRGFAVLYVTTPPSGLMREAALCGEGGFKSTRRWGGLCQKSGSDRDAGVAFGADCTAHLFSSGGTGQRPRLQASNSPGFHQKRLEIGKARHFAFEAGKERTCAGFLSEGTELNPPALASNRRRAGGRLRGRLWQSGNSDRTRLRRSRARLLHCLIARRVKVSPSVFGSGTGRGKRNRTDDGRC